MRDIVVVGASAGGVEALIQLVGELPEGFPGAVFIVLHMAAESGTMLPSILARHTTLPVGHPGDGDAIAGGRVYVAVPDRHLTLREGRIGLLTGPKENGHRPAIDPLFRSAADSFGPRVVGVILSGTRDDGTAGLRAVHDGGGYAIVQDPDDALFPDMPRNALAADHPDIVLPVAEIADHLAHLTGWTPARARPTAPEPRSALASGRAGPESWPAYRALEERVALCRRLADRAEARQAGISAERFRAQAVDLSRQAENLRAVLRAQAPSDESESGS